MKALIHIDPTTKKVVGVWTSKAGTPASYYSEAEGGTAYQQQVGAEAMRRKKPEASWDNWCAALSARTPVTAWWETSDFDSKMTPKEIFAAVRS